MVNYLLFGLFRKSCAKFWPLRQIGEHLSSPLIPLILFTLEFDLLTAPNLTYKNNCDVFNILGSHVPNFGL